MFLTFQYLFGFDDNYLVNLDGSGDFTNITDAVSAVAPGQYVRIIVVGPAVYSGLDNRNIQWNGNVKNIELRGINNPIIDSGGYEGWTFRIDNGTDVDIIKGLTIQNAHTHYGDYEGSAIQINGGNPRIYENTFIECGFYWPAPDIGTIRGGAIHIDNASGAVVAYNIFDDNFAFFGGAVSVRNSDKVIIKDNFFTGNSAAVNILASHEVQIFNNVFENNYAVKGGAALTFEAFSPNDNYSGTIKNNDFRSNHVYSYPAGYVIMYHTSVVLFHNNYGYMNNTNSIDFSYNVFANNYGSGEYYHSIVCFQDRDELFEAKFNNNTFADNSNFSSVIQDWSGSNIGNLNLINTLFFNNYEQDAILDGGFDLAYCLFYGYDELSSISSDVNIGTGCLIDIDPLIDEEYSPIWDDTTFSPIIDTGHPGIIDPDGTPSDIGE